MINYSDSTDAHTLEGVYPPASYFDSVLSSLNLNSESLVLDISSGNGFEADFLAKKYSCKVLRHDVTSFGLKKNSETPAFISSVDHLSLPADTLDLVHQKDGLVHIADLNTYFAEIARVLKKEGMLIITTALPKNNTAIVNYSFDSKGTSSTAERITFKNVDEYEKILLNPTTKLHWRDVYNVSVSPPYFALNPEQIIKIAKIHGFSLANKSEWHQTTSEQNWDQGTRTVFTFVKTS